MLRAAKLVKVSCIFTKKNASKVITKLQDIGIVHLIKSKPANGFKPVLIDEGESKRLTELLGRANNLIKLIEIRTLKPFFREIFGPRYIYAMPKDGYTKKLDKKLLHFEKKYKILRYTKAKISASDYSEIVFIRNIVKDELDRHEVLQLFSESKYLMKFEGWLENSNWLRVKSSMEHATKNTCVFTMHKPKVNDEVPTLLKNPGIVKPFEIFTENYGTPNYWEIEPTPITALTFPLIFGLMFADVGYGLSLAALSIFVYIYTTKESKFRKSLNLVFIYLGISSAIFGIIFGEFFGFSFRRGIDPVSDIILFLLIAILIGLMHISIGILTKILSNIKNKGIVIQGISMLTVIWSAVSLYNWQSIYNKSLLLIGLVALLFSQRLEMFKELLSLLIGALSYMRIAILGIGHLVINRLLVSSYSELSTTFLGAILFIIVFVIGSLIVLTLGIFITVLQDIRLHWVEFFPKFLSGKGIKFKPFRHTF